MQTKDLVKAFVVGSSLPVFGVYFLAVLAMIRSGQANIDYKRYSITAPLFLGFLNVLGLIIANAFTLSNFSRYMMTSLIGFIFIGLLLQIKDMYNYPVYNYTTFQEWAKHYVVLFLVYIIVYNLIVYFIEQNIC